MPFDFQKYDEKCAAMSGDELQLEWEHYTRLISGAATSTAVSGMAVPFTLGVSTIGIGLAAPAIHNARKKREIIEKHLQRHGRTSHTRKRDVIVSSAISGTVGVVALGLAPPCTDMIVNHAAEHGITYITENEMGVKVVTHLALDGAAVAAEEVHMHSKKEQEAWKAYQKAVKEGKNPPLPSSSHFNLPSANQAANTNPLIVLAPEKQQDGILYFPPPPGQSDTKSANLYNRRHSTSTLSCEAHSLDQKPQANGHFMYGTTTAISAPMWPGQNYALQVPGQYTDPPSRPASAMGLGSSVQHKPTFPPPPPSPGHEIHPSRPRAHSLISYDSLPSYAGHQSTQLVYGTAIPPPPPTSPSKPSGAPIYSTSDQSSSIAKHLGSSPPLQGQTHLPYNPSDYKFPQQQNFPSAVPVGSIAVHQEGSYNKIDPEVPLVYVHDTQNSLNGTSQLNVATTSTFTTPDPQQPSYQTIYQPQPPEKRPGEQMQYFAPPPTSSSYRY